MYNFLSNSVTSDSIARQKMTKQRSLQVVNEHAESFFNKARLSTVGIIPRLPILLSYVAGLHPSREAQQRDNSITAME